MIFEISEVFQGPNCDLRDLIAKDFSKFRTGKKIAPRVPLVGSLTSGVSATVARTWQAWKPTGPTVPMTGGAPGLAGSDLNSRGFLTEQQPTHATDWWDRGHAGASWREWHARWHPAPLTCGPGLAVRENKRKRGRTGARTRVARADTVDRCHWAGRRFVLDLEVRVVLRCIWCGKLKLKKKFSY